MKRVKKTLSILLSFIVIFINTFALTECFAATEYDKPTETWVINYRNELRDYLMDWGKKNDKGEYYFSSNTTSGNQYKVDDIYTSNTTKITYSPSSKIISFTVDHYMSKLSKWPTTGSYYSIVNESTYTMDLSLTKYDEVSFIKTSHDTNSRTNEDTKETIIAKFHPADYTNNCEKDIRYSNGVVVTDSKKISYINSDISSFSFTKWENLLSNKGFHLYNLGFCNLCTYHSVSSSKKPASCTKDGYTIYTCSKCGKSYKDEYVYATGHSYSTKVVKPTYAAKGYTLHTCSTCKSSYKDKYKNKLTVAKPTISKVTSPKSKQIKITWGKKTYTGYQVQIATDKKFTKNKKSATIKSANTVTKTFTKLKGKTKYYVRVRAYKTYNGKNYYSSWSTVKSVTTKK